MGRNAWEIKTRRRHLVDFPKDGYRKLAGAWGIMTLLGKSYTKLELLSLPSTSASLHRHRYYASAQIELNAEEYNLAEPHFNVTIECCRIQDSLFYKAHSMRGLGEVAFAHGDFASASQFFGEMQNVCVKMGIPPPRLYNSNPLCTASVPERFEGWALFLEGRSPFTTSM